MHLHGLTYVLQHKLNHFVTVHGPTGSVLNATVLKGLLHCLEQVNSGLHCNRPVWTHARAQSCIYDGSVGALPLQVHSKVCIRWYEWNSDADHHRIQLTTNCGYVPEQRECYRGDDSMQP